MADLRLAAWFLWITPLLAALSSLTEAARMARVASSAFPASAASRNLRTEVFSSDLTALLRRRAFSFCLLRLIWDLIFATRMPRYGLSRWSGGARHEPTSRELGASRPARQTRACRQPEAKDSRDRPDGSN